MTGKKLIGMAIVLAVLAGILFVQKQSGDKRRPDEAEAMATLLQGLDLNVVDGVEITKGSNVVSLVKQEGAWIVETLYNYPADFKKLADALRTASEVKMGSPVRASNVGTAEYGLDEARSITLKSAGRESVTVDVGARREASSAAGWANQHFVRKGGADDIYLVDYDFHLFAEESVGWIGTELINVSSSDIVSVKTGDIALSAVSNVWTLIGLNDETEELNSSEASKLRTALQYLNCRTVADPILSDEVAGFTDAAVYTAQDRNGLVYTVILGGESNNQRYARFSVAYEKPEAPAAPADDAGQEDKTAYEELLETYKKNCEASEKRAAALNAKLAGWTYLISSGDAGDFIIGRDQLVQAKEKSDGEEKGDPAEE